MKLVILKYDETGALTKIVKDSNLSVDTKELRQLKLDKDSNLIGVSFMVNDADDIDECIEVLQSKPKVARQLMVVKNNAEFYREIQEYEIIQTIINKVIDDLKSMHNK